ncbi:MAG: Hsp20/alpha crystallin family protein [Anaerolineae bacterium]
MPRVSPWYGGTRSWAPWRWGGRAWDEEAWGQELPANIYDSAETWIVTLPVPGMEADDVELDCEGDVITVHAAPKGQPHLPKDYVLHEWHVGPYYRRLELPAIVDARACEASVTAGMLVIRIRKPEWEREVHIPVQGAGAEVVEGQSRVMASAGDAGSALS